MGRSSVYSCMTNGGIIEGNTENSGFSDLSLATYLGVDVKQKQQTSWGAQAVLGRPLP
jgi:hypothetical protein